MSAIDEWRAAGSVVTDTGVDHEVREAMLIELAREHDLRVFVETGTARGGMLEALLDHFDALYSVELDQKYYEVCSLGVGINDKVKIWHCDSPMWLERFIPYLDDGVLGSTPALVFLDGHFSGEGTGVSHLGETPVFFELGICLSHPRVCPVVVVDDARLFDVDPAYPGKEYVRRDAESKGYSCEFEADAIILKYETGKEQA